MKRRQRSQKMNKKIKWITTDQVQIIWELKIFVKLSPWKKLIFFFDFTVRNNPHNPHNINTHILNFRPFLLKWRNGRKWWTFFMTLRLHKIRQPNEIHFIFEICGLLTISSNPIVLLPFYSSNDFSFFLSPPFVLTNFSCPFISIFCFDYYLVHNFVYKNPFRILTLAFVLIVIMMLYTHQCTKTKQCDDRNFGIDPNLKWW